MSNKFLPFWWLLLSVCLVLVVYPLIQNGMFTDGMVYTAVGKNLANGLGSFWHPHYAKALMPLYHDQPPLMFGMEAVFFKVLGNSMYVERFYAFTMFVFSALLIYLIWRRWNLKVFELHDLGWFPLVLWVIVPVVYWAVANNVEENTMVAFVLASFYAFQRGVEAGKHSWLWMLTAGLFILGAGLCKGVQGMFTLSVVFFYWLFYRRLTFLKMVSYSLLLVLPTLIFVVAALLTPEIWLSFQMYYERRILNTFINTEMATTQFRFYLILQLFNELIPSLILILILMVAGWKLKYRNPELRNRLKDGLFFLVIGLAGSLPLLVTFEQRRFYLVTAMPFFVLAISILGAPVLAALLRKTGIHMRGFRVFRSITAVLLVGAVIFTFTGIGKTKRDVDLLNDVHQIGAFTGEGSTVTIPASLFEEWALHAYFNRYYYISLTTDSSAMYLLKKSDDKVLTGSGYVNIVLPTTKYKLYRKQALQ